MTNGSKDTMCGREAIHCQNSSAAPLWGQLPNRECHTSTVLAAMLRPKQRSINGNKYIKNYEFDFNFGSAWGHCAVTMTSVVGHLSTLDFEQQYRQWNSCQPGRLFDAPTVNYVDPV